VTKYDDLRHDIKDLEYALEHANDDLLADFAEVAWRHQLAEGFEAVHAATGRSIDKRRAKAFRESAEYLHRQLVDGWL